MVSSIDAGTGLITGTLGAAGGYSVTLAVSDGELGDEAHHRLNCGDPRRRHGHPVGLGTQRLRAARGRHHHQPVRAHPDQHRHRLGHRHRRQIPHGGGEGRRHLWAWGDTLPGSPVTAPPPPGRYPFRSALTPMGDRHRRRPPHGGGELGRHRVGLGQQQLRQLGDGTTINRYVPIQISTDTEWATYRRTLPRWR